VPVFQDVRLMMGLNLRAASRGKCFSWRRRGFVFARYHKRMNTTMLPPDSATKRARQALSVPLFPRAQITVCGALAAAHFCRLWTLLYFCWLFRAKLGKFAAQ
jgi:hypothetical protein